MHPVMSANVEMTHSSRRQDLLEGRSIVSTLVRKASTASTFVKRHAPGTMSIRDDAWIRVGRHAHTRGVNSLAQIRALRAKSSVPGPVHIVIVPSHVARFVPGYPVTCDARSFWHVGTSALPSAESHVMSKSVKFAPRNRSWTKSWI